MELRAVPLGPMRAPHRARLAPPAACGSACSSGGAAAAAAAAVAAARSEAQCRKLTWKQGRATP